EKEPGRPWPSLSPASPGDSGGDLDLDLLRLGFLTQRQPHRQHAGLVLGADLASVDGRRQRERPRERAITSLDALELLLRDFHVVLPIAEQHESVVFVVWFNYYFIIIWHIDLTYYINRA